MPREQTKTYDVTLKDLVAMRPRDIVTLAGITDALDVRVEDTDLSSIVAAVDKVLRVRLKRGELLVHVEFQSGYDGSLPGRVFWYNAALHHRHELPVVSVVVLLTKKADSPKITGAYAVKAPTGQECITFRYDVVRLWQIPVATILSGPIGLLPLAPLCQGTEEIEPVIARMDCRIHAEASRPEEGKLWLATYALLGLRVDAEQAMKLIPKEGIMKESTTYQAILEEGRVEEARKFFLLIAEKRLGAPPPPAAAALDSIRDKGTFEALAARSLEVESWEELIRRLKPTSAGRKKKR